MTGKGKTRRRAPESIETDDARSSLAKASAASGLRLVLSTAHDLVSVPIENGKTYVIGREDADIVVPDGSVSRRHAEVVVLNDGSLLTIVDLGSRNGTKVNGVELSPNDSPTPIALGAAFMVGTATLVAHRAPSAGASSSKQPRDDGGTLIRAKSMIDLYATLDIVARSELSVLVLGETGTGKELVAEHIHLRSGRSGPLLRINCAALPESILDAELFGYERGAFTGATHAKIGLLEAADKGTLFLDEVGEMPTTVQAKLLRFLEDHEVVRLGAAGGSAPRKVDVRIVAATHRDLRADMVSGGLSSSFRSDLYFRLDGISARIPPLRERREEILPLALRFANRAAAAIGRAAAPDLHAEARAALENHPFPGNIRELKSAIERAVILSKGSPTIRVEHLMLTSSSSSSSSSSPSASLGDAIDVLERARIMEALTACNGNQSQAARQLGISRHTLMSRMDDFGLERPKKKSSPLQ